MRQCARGRTHQRREVLNLNVNGYKKLLSIAIPTYNRAHYLDLCLSQICKQLPGNEQDIELIVSDNASPDNTEEVVKKYIDRGIDLKYIKTVSYTHLTLPTILRV